MTKTSLNDTCTEMMEPVQIEDMLDVLQDVKRERYRQHDKWGEQNRPVAQWALILNEEVGEVNQELCGHHFDGLDPQRKELRNELVQVAAVAVQMIEWLDREIRKHRHATTDAGAK